MLYGYKFTLAQMGQIRNYKKQNNFTYTLLDIKDIKLSTFEIDCNISYKKTIPLNMFEKYSIRLIDKAYELYEEMSISKISKLLHIDKNLIEENLKNLEAIDMLNGIDSDNIIINRAKNAQYLRYENKFKIEHIELNYHLTSREHQNFEDFIKKEFEKDKRNRDKKFQSIDILDNKESFKNVSLLNYSNNQFLIFSKSGINSQNDLKFIEKDSFESINSNIPKDIFCNYDEFLPILRDEINRENSIIIIIGSKDIEDNYLNIITAKEEGNIYILSDNEKKHSRIFNISSDDFVLIKDNLYKKIDGFIFKIDDINYKSTIHKKLKKYFENKILEIEDNYDIEKNNKIEEEIKYIKEKIDRYNFRTKKEFDAEIKKVNTQKNKLYGLTSKNAQTRAKTRQKINTFEEENNIKELEKYSEYMKNITISLEGNKYEVIRLTNYINELNNQKSKPISKGNKEKISLFEKELKNIRLLETT